jgi:DNA-binding SARP family transcriptional activator/TolB-like protein
MAANSLIQIVPSLWSPAFADRLAGGEASGGAGPTDRLGADRRKRTDSRFLVCSFGRFRVVDLWSLEPVRLRSRKASAALAYLTFAGQGAVTRDRLAFMLWGDRGEEQARGSLRQVLAEIRASSVSEALRADRRQIALSPHLIRTEAQHLSELADRHDYVALAAALEAMDERVLDDLDGIDRGFDEWLIVERERQRRELIQRLMPVCTDAPKASLEQCRAILSSLQRLDPIDEALTRLGLELDYKAGDLAALHRRYRALEAGLKRDYQASPSSDTQALFRRLTTVAPVPSERQAPRPVQPPSAGAPLDFQPPVVVLPPLELTGGGPDDALLAQVCLAELETALSGIAGLRVLSLPDPTSGALSAACAASIASYTLHCTLTVFGGTLRLNWRLIRISDGMLIWSRKSAVARADVGEMMEDVVGRVAGAVLPAVERDIDGIVQASEPQDASAYELYFRGRIGFLSAVTLADMQQAADLFEQAITREPKLVNGYLSLARLFNTDFEQRMAGHDHAPLRARAFELTAKAMALDPLSAQARAKMGWCYLRRGDMRQARLRFEEALTLSPNHADCVNEIGFAFCLLGDFDRARSLLERAFELNPFPRDDYFCDMGVLHMLMGEHVRAEEQFEVSRGEGLHYRACRIASRALIGPREDTALALDALRRDFRAIWVGPEGPTDRDLLGALFGFMPFPEVETASVLVRGLIAAGMEGLEG